MRGMTTRDTSAHLRELHEVDVSPDLIPRIANSRTVIKLRRRRARSPAVISSPPVSVGWVAAEEAPERLFGGVRASAELGSARRAWPLAAWVGL